MQVLLQAPPVHQFRLLAVRETLQILHGVVPETLVTPGMANNSMQGSCIFKETGEVMQPMRTSQMSA